MKRKKCQKYYYTTTYRDISTFQWGAMLIYVQWSTIVVITDFHFRNHNEWCYFLLFPYVNCKCSWWSHIEFGSIFRVMFFLPVLQLTLLAAVMNWFATRARTKKGQVGAAVGTTFKNFCHLHFLIWGPMIIISRTFWWNTMSYTSGLNGIFWPINGGNKWLRFVLRLGSHCGRILACPHSFPKKST